VKSGKVRYIGASSLWAWEFTKTLYLQTLNGWARFVSIQDHYNLLDSEEEREVYPLCPDQGIGVMPWSPLARGKLTRDWNATTTRSQTDPTQDFRYESDADQAIVAKVAEIAAETRRPQGAGGSGVAAPQRNCHRPDRRCRQATTRRRRHRRARSPPH
jgi:1-deoxyxylulose-5-phosphate synthase